MAEVSSATAKSFDPRTIGQLQDRSQDKELESGEVVQFVSFTVGESEYCVDIMSVREIKGWADVTTLPNTPEYVRGVLNLRGVIVPIFDLRCRFHQGLTDASPLHVVIIVAVGDRVMGLLVDTVSDIITVNTDDILPAPTLEKKVEERFLEGLITVQKRMVALLTIERLFDIDTMVNAMLEEQN